MSRMPSAGGIEVIASVTQRLAVLLAAGVSPTAAWSYLVDDPVLTPPAVRRGIRSIGRRGRMPPDAGSRQMSRRRRTEAREGDRPGRVGARSAHDTGSMRADAAGLVRATAEAAERGDSVAAALAAEADRLDSSTADGWRGLAAAWYVATESGAPLAQSLRDLAAAFRSLGQTRREFAVALASPTSTARMVMALPVIGILFGLGMGFDTLGILFTSPPGLVCLVVGVFLVLAGWRWNRALVAAAQPKNLTPGLNADLMAVAMSSGLSVDRARLLVTEAMARYGLTDAGTDRVESVLSLSSRAGVPAVELLRSEADQIRREATADGQRAASSLAVRLMIPLGVCVLPAFMLVGVAPLLMAVISSTMASF